MLTVFDNEEALAMLRVTAVKDLQLPHVAGVFSRNQVLEVARGQIRWLVLDVQPRRMLAISDRNRGCALVKHRCWLRTF